MIVIVTKESRRFPMCTWGRSLRMWGAILGEKISEEGAPEEVLSVSLPFRPPEKDE